MEFFNKIKSLGIFLGILLILAGVICLVFPQGVVKVLALAVGIGILTYGALRAITVIVKWNEIPLRVLKISLAGIFLILGVFLLVNSNVTISAAGIVVGVLALVSAADRFGVAIERKKEGLRFGSTVVFGLIHLLFGVGMIYASLTMIAFLVMIVGIYVLLAGIMVILSTGYFFDF